MREIHVLRINTKMNFFLIMAQLVKLDLLTTTLLTGHFFYLERMALHSLINMQSNLIQLKANVG